MRISLESAEQEQIVEMLMLEKVKMCCQTALRSFQGSVC